VSACALRSTKEAEWEASRQASWRHLSRGRLEVFADDIFDSLPRKDQRARRSSRWPSGWGEVHYQAVHHFVAVSPWDWRLFLPQLDELIGLAGGGGVRVFATMPLDAASGEPW
jgi:hypothetical protein